MNAMPSLNGSVGYIFTSCELDIKNSGNVRFKDMVERFKLYSQPKRPEGKEEWLAGQRVDSRGMSPSAISLHRRLETLTDRVPRQIISSMVACTFLPVDWMRCIRPGYLPLYRLWSLPYPTRDRASPEREERAEKTRVTSCSACNTTLENGAPSIHGVLKMECGAYACCIILAGSATLQSLPRMLAPRSVLGPSAWTRKMLLGVDSRVVSLLEQNFTSVQRRKAREVRRSLCSDQTMLDSSFAVSTGIRFTTLSETESSSSSRGVPSQPPTTITALFNPMMGHVSTAYAAKVSRDLSLCSRFDFNVYSYDSEWTMGAEWWMRRALSQPISDNDAVGPPDPNHPPGSPHSNSDIRGVVKTRISTNNVCCTCSLSRFTLAQLPHRLCRCYGKDG